ncbi:MAG: transglutaminase domain-containing protein [Lachnospiraceae bacterium]|nr:transglutaminase domain-containing protein [Lachnospiraceae bacterium]
MKKRRYRRILSVILACLMLFTDCSVHFLNGGGLSKVHAAETAGYAEYLNTIGFTENESDLDTAEISAEYVGYLEKAEELGTPLAVYNYLKNNINYEYYSGRRKGAEATFDSLGGNDADQAQLLSAMLNHLGYETRYVTGRIRIDIEDAMAYTGATDAALVGDIFAMSHPGSILYSDAQGNPLYVETDHVWVEAHVPYGDYRGAGAASGEKLWIPLDTCFKTYIDNDTIFEQLERQEDIHLDVEVLQKLSTREELLAELEAFYQSIESYSVSAGDVYLSEKRICKEELKFLPLSLTFEVVEEYDCFTEWSDENCDSIAFSLNGAPLKELKSYELYNKQLFLRYEEQGNGSLQAVLTLDGEIVARGAVVAEGMEETFTMKVYSGGKTTVAENKVKAGSFYQITTDMQMITARELTESLERVRVAAESVTDENAYSEGYLGALLDYAGKLYFAQVDIENYMLAQQYDVTVSRTLSVAMTGYEKGPQGDVVFIDVDIDGRVVATNTKDAENIKRFSLAAGMVSSMFESIVWEQLLGTPSVSTISALEQAVRADKDILLIKEENWESIKEDLSVSESVYWDIENAIMEGKLVLVPKEEVTIAEWTGSGYLILDPALYTGAYRISGGINGGTCAVGCTASFIGNMLVTATALYDLAKLFPVIISMACSGTVLGVVGAGILLVAFTKLLLCMIDAYLLSINLYIAALEGDKEAEKMLQGMAVYNVLFEGVCHFGGKYIGKVLNSYSTQKVLDSLGKTISQKFVTLFGRDEAVKVISALRRSGITDRVIKDAALELTDKQLQNLGNCAMKEFPQELLETLIKNPEVLDYSADTLKIFKDSIFQTDTIMDLIKHHGDDFINLYQVYRDDVAEIFWKYGDDFAEIYAKYGDECVEEIIQNGDTAFNQYKEMLEESTGGGGLIGGGEVVEGGTSFADNISDILLKEGLTLNEFNELRMQDVSTLSNAEKETLRAIRESIPMPDQNTLMQKVIPASDIEKYMDGTYTQVGGFVTRAEDVAHLNTYDEIYSSLRLDYLDSPYKPMEDNSIGVIRYTTDETSKITIAYGPEMGGTITEAPPFTGNGFTKATNGEIIPEFKCNSYLDIADGSQLIEIGKNGEQTLIGVYSETQGKFLPVQ